MEVPKKVRTSNCAEVARGNQILDSQSLNSASVVIFKVPSVSKVPASVDTRVQSALRIKLSFFTSEKVSDTLLTFIILIARNHSNLSIFTTLQQILTRICEKYSIGTGKKR